MLLPGYPERSISASPNIVQFQPDTDLVQMPWRIPGHRELRIAPRQPVPPGG